MESKVDCQDLQDGKVVESSKAAYKDIMDECKNMINHNKKYSGFLNYFLGGGLVPKQNMLLVFRVQGSQFKSKKSGKMKLKTVF